MSDTLLTINETADILKVHWQSVRNYIDSKELKASKIGKNIRIKKSDLDAFINSKKPQKEIAEVELRYLCKDRKAIENKLITIGARVTHLSHIVDHWYIGNHIKNLEEKNRDFDSGEGFGLRIREQDNDYTGKITTSLEVKRLTDALNHNTCIESEIEVKNYEETNNLLKLMNLKEFMTIDKARIMYSFEDLKICIDDIKELGTGIEIEHKTEKNREMVVEEIRNFARKLGLKKEDEVVKSVTYLAMEKLSRY